MRRRTRLPSFILTGMLAVVALPDPSISAPTVELITIGPGHAAETRFGHNLLRVIDAETRSDDVYDFGVADFRRPDFLAEVVMGVAKFRLRRFSSQARFEDYVRQDRQIDTQRLNLTDAQIADLLERLEQNLLPQNAEYVFNPVVDNCSIRVRDLLNEVTGGALQRIAYEIPVFRTYREDILAAGSGQLLALIGFDLATGPHGEDRVRTWQLSYVPEQLSEIVAVSENPALGEGVPLVASDTVLHQRNAQPAAAASVRAGREMLLAVGAGLGLFFGMIGFLAWRTDKANGWLSRLAGLVLIPTAALFGLLGLALLPMALFSAGTIWASNQNAWIFFPLDLLLLVPALRWLWTGRASLGAQTRVYIDIRFLMIVIGWTGVAWPQDNGTFALAAGLVLGGLRTLPLRAK